MMLSNVDIRQMLDLHPGMFVPPVAPEAIQPCSIDIRLGINFRRPGEPEGFDYTEGYYLDPGDSVLGRSLERVKVPHSVALKLSGKSSIGRLFTSVHITAGLIDPGFDGTVTFELTNHLKDYAIRLIPGMYIAQLEVHRLSSVAKPVYGEATGAHYQEQIDATPSALEEKHLTRVHFY